MSAPPPSASLVSALIQHYDTSVLPLWTGAGWHAAMRLPYEALSAADGKPLPVSRYRAMACARQLYVFSRDARDAAHAEVLFDSLRRVFADPRGGWYYSVDATGAPLDDSKDLYTHAFVVFACAAYFRQSGNAAALAVMRETVDLIEDRFAIADGAGGLYRASLAADLRAGDDTVLQNPMMHLTEAYLAAHAATGDDAYATRLARLADAMLRTFVDTATGCIAELPLGSADNRIEPGHQFEWYSLVSMGRPLFGDSPLVASLDRAYAFACRHGVAAQTQGVHAALDLQGDRTSVKDGTQRIWAQTEYARALALRDDAAAREALGLWLVQFPRRFLHARGWMECLAADGSVLRAEMPSTTPYHLATAYEALRERVS
ncbi:AGE family epimerase/isomerase [Cupriavidus respiraculi]|uniref:AGE family epimerase/isomerase n=1 Tax=Cupriavidus respiraculi TaxID=195930 RepID=UPI001C972B8B|nr:AGE family epimerase/isomerase [Cupriavidus respiraculi]MBY4949762.1 AGE family epimerase/isomerase [Cupriavidus respiraculi]